MAFPTGWTKKCPLVIDADQVSGTANLTDFPVLLTEVNFPSTIFDNTQTTGADLRFTSDSAGTTELAFEVVTWDTTDDKAEVWVKVPTVDYDDDTTFYVWYGNAEATAYAVTDTYGRNAVWSDYLAVWHLTNANDSSASGYNLTASASAPTSTAGLIGSATTGAYDFEASTKQYFTNTSTPNLGITTAETVSLWFKPEGGGVNNQLFGLWSSNGYTNGLRDIITNDPDGDVWRIRQTGTSGFQQSDEASVALTHGNTFYVVGSWDPANLKFYRYTNGGNYDEDTMASTTKAFTGNVITWVGFNNTDSIDGIVDEIRVQDRILSSDWIATEYNNQSAPATFITEGTEESIGGGTGCLFGFLGKGIIPSVRNC
jgi:hypothetical protein